MNRFLLLIKEILKLHAKCIVGFFGGDIWTLRLYIRKGGKDIWKSIYYSYFEHYGAFVGLGAEFLDIPCFPHGLMGIFISNSARIGKGCVIFQQVTIGSNTLKDSKNFGAPHIGDNVYIGSGAKIIGAVKIGNNCRIGANAIIVKDMPDNSVAIMRGLEVVVKTEVLDNKYVANREPRF